MGIKVNFKGVEYTVATVKDAAALGRELTGEAPAKASRAKNGEDLFPPRPDPDAQRAVDLLELLQRSADEGPSLDDLMLALQTNNSKGIGGRMAMINRMLQKSGFDDLDDVYTNPKIGDSRIWRAGPRIQEAISKLRKKHSAYAANAA